MNAKSIGMALAVCASVGFGAPAGLAQGTPDALPNIALPNIALPTTALPTTAQAADAPAADARHCLAPGAWAVPDASAPRPDRVPAVLAAMAARDVVLLGEQHDDADHHRWQLHTLAALHAQRPDMAIGFEMFPRRVQPVLDRWVAGELSVQAFLEQTEWDAVWNMPAELYLPLFQFARLNRIPMIALNVERALIRKISDTGWAGVTDAEREGVGRAARPPAAYLDFLRDIQRQHAEMRGEKPPTTPRTDAAFRNFVDAQLMWDRAMAEALARPLTAAAVDGTPAVAAARPLVVGIMGSGHIRFGHGVPHQLRDLGVARVGTLLPVSTTAPCSDFPAGLADAVFAVPSLPETPPPPPRLGVRLDAHSDGVRIAAVTAGSLAEATGLRAEDIIIEAAGAPTPKVVSVVASIRTQPAGTWLPLKVKRGAETLELVVKFPARS